MDEQITGKDVDYDLALLVRQITTTIMDCGAACEESPSYAIVGLTISEMILNLERIRVFMKKENLPTDKFDAETAKCLKEAKAQNEKDGI